MAKLPKRKVVTIVMTLALLLSAAGVQCLNLFGVFDRYPFFVIVMLTSTAVYVFFGCMFQAFGLVKVSIGIGVVVFFILCTCLFYSVYIVDFIVFFICMAIVIHRSSHSCQCLEQSGQCKPAK